MNYRKKLFSGKNMYDLAGSDEVFIEAVKENILFHRERCLDYNNLLEHLDFDVKEICGIEDLHKVPFIPTLYYKKWEMFSMPYEKMMFKATTSGTSGKATRAGLDASSSYYALLMVLKTFSHYKLISPVLTNYIVMGYEPNKSNKVGASQTAFGTTLLAPARHREYALKYVGNGYELNNDGLLRSLIKYEKQKSPVRFMGFPSYLHLLLKELKKEGIKLSLSKNGASKVFTAGGFKGFVNEKIEKAELQEMVLEYLGIEAVNCKDFYGAVEHPICYCDCDNNNFHVPIYSRVIIRDVKTFLPVSNGTVGLVNLITPLVYSMPLVSVMTDDLGIMYDGRECGCGNSSPFFKILGRAGVDGVKTCVQGANDIGLK